MLCRLLGEAVNVAAHEHAHLHRELLLLLQQLRVVVLVGGDHDAVGIGIKGKLLACGGACTLTTRLYGLERAISVIVVEKISLVAFVEIFFDILQAELAAVLADGLQLGFGKEAVDLRYFGHLLELGKLLQIVSFLSLGC